MSTDVLVRPLLQIPIFRGLKPLQLTEIIRRADRAMFQQGSVIIRDGEAAESAVLIVSGEAIRVYGPEKGRMAEPVASGSLLAEMAMLIETEHSSTVVARTPVKALKIHRFEMLRQMTEDPGLAHHFVNHISGRLSRLADELRRVDDLMGSTLRPQQTEHRVQIRASQPNPAAVLH